MEKLKDLTWTIIDKYLDEGLLMANKHPTKSLWILNYTQKVQFERLWDDITLNCRGLVVDSSANIVARPFKKFFNVEEHEDAEFLPSIPKDTSYQAFEKMDGSLGILFNHKNDWIFASRGSFTSEQAIKGRGMLDAKGYVARDDATKQSLWDVISKDNTYVFEIIYPENRIVVNYGSKNDVVLLGVINTKTGEEVAYGEMKTNYRNIFSIVMRYEGVGEFNKLKETFQDDVNEGLVIKIGKERYKLKWDEYVRLHKIVTNISNKDVWNHLKEKMPFDKILERVPDEFFKWVKKTRADLESQYNAVEVESLKLFLEVYTELGASMMIKKEFALKVKDTKYAGILFNMYDGKDYAPTIWKQIKPKWSTPFKDGVDES